MDEMFGGCGWMKMRKEGRKEWTILWSTESAEFFPEPFCKSLNAHFEGGIGGSSGLALRHVIITFKLNPLGKAEIWQG